MRPFVRGDELAAFLQVDQECITRWRGDGWLNLYDREEREHGTLGHPLYERKSIEQLLRANPNHPDALKDMPSLEELEVLAGVLELPALLTRQQASEWLGVTISTLDALLRADLPSIRLVPGGSIRILLPSLIDYAERRAQAVPMDLTAGLLGVGVRKAIRLTPADGSGPLLRQRLSGVGRKIFVQRESLLQFLDKNVAQGTAEEWWQMRRQSNFEPLMTIQEVHITYHVGASRLEEAIAAGVVPCLYLPGSTVRVSRIPLTPVETWAFTLLELRHDRVGHILGVPHSAIKVWEKNNQICPTPHDVHICRACLVAYIESNKIGTFNAKGWLKTADSHPKRSVLLGELPQLTQLPINEALIAIGTGKLRGVRLPPGEIVVLRTDVEELATSQG